MQDILSSGLICVLVWDFSVYLDSVGPKRLLWSSFGLVLARDFLCITIRLQEHLLLL